MMYNGRKGYIDLKDFDYRNNSKGFSLVELIIVIAIMAILASAIAPALIRYIVKARKADDIATADALGTTLMAAMSEDEEMYTWLTTIAADHPAGRKYTAIAKGTAVGGLSPQDFELVDFGWANLRDIDRNIFKKKMNEYLGAGAAPMKFMNQRYMDQWIICVDKDCKLYVFVGGGFNSHDQWIQDDGHKVYNNHGRVYMLWPEVDPDYMALNTPPKDF